MKIIYIPIYLEIRSDREGAKTQMHVVHCVDLTNHRKHTSFHFYFTLIVYRQSLVMQMVSIWLSYEIKHKIRIQYLFFF